MSLFRPERLHISIESDRAAIVKVRGWRKPIVMSDKVLTLNGPATDLPAFLQPLREVLNQSDFQKHAATIVLADSWVRYFICSKPVGVRNTSELQSVISAEFESQFGLPSNDWILSADLPPSATRYLVSAAPRELVAAIRDVCASARVRVDSLSPFLVSEINARHKRLPARQSAWITAIDRTHITSALWDPSGWRAVRSQLKSPGIDAGLGQMLAREELRIDGVAPVVIGVSGIAVGNLEDSRDPLRLDAALWPGRAESWSQQHRLALSGIWP